MKYLIIQLCDSAPSFCHYDNGNSDELISLDVLRESIIWAMKRNTSVQVVYPKFEIPNEYKELLNSIAHAGIVGSDCCDNQILHNAKIIIIKDVKTEQDRIKPDVSYVLRLDSESLLRSNDKLIPYFQNAQRVNIIITDIQLIKEPFFVEYKKWLERISEVIKREYLRGHLIQCNLLTDRFMLDKMNNCDAGHDSVTIAPNGKFYVCPAFYFDKMNHDPAAECTLLGDIHKGIKIKNSQLYDLDYAPLCRICDAFQCKRCVWLNKRMTYEVNTPSHQQCVLAHLERNASRLLLRQIQENTTFLPEKKIKEIDYLDPFDIKPIL